MYITKKLLFTKQIRLNVTQEQFLASPYAVPMSQKT